MTIPLIVAKELTKDYRLFRRPRDRFLDMLMPSGKLRYTRVRALDNVSFSVRPGECLGLIGPNGSGKSTLLKLLVGSVAPSAGQIELKGSILAILELGAGLNPDLTGRENIHAVAALFGFPADYAHSREADIIAFCDIGGFIDLPVRKYSTGMLTRLGFSIFSFLEPDILIIDEVLAVGDADFQLKCFRRIEQLIGDRNRAVILVSHDMNAINRFCDRAIWLSEGRIAAEGDPGKVSRAYIMSSTRQAVEATPAAAASNESAGNLPLTQSAITYHSDICTITSAWIETGSGQRTVTVPQGEAFRICYSISFHEEMHDPVFGIRLVNKRGDVVVSTNSQFERMHIEPVSAGTELELHWPIPANLLPGDYFLSCGISHAANLHDFVVRYIDAFPVRILGKSAAAGYVMLAASPTIKLRS